MAVIAKSTGNIYPAIDERRFAETPILALFPIASDMTRDFRSSGGGKGLRGIETHDPSDSNANKGRIGRWNKHEAIG